LAIGIGKPVLSDVDRISQAHHSGPSRSSTGAGSGLAEVAFMRPEWTRRISLENVRPLASLFSEDLAIDLGTVNTRVYAPGRGIVINEASAVALDESTGEVRAVGKEAKESVCE